MLSKMMRLINFKSNFPVPCWTRLRRAKNWTLCMRLDAQIYLLKVSSFWLLLLSWLVCGFPPSYGRCCSWNTRCSHVRPPLRNWTRMKTSRNLQVPVLLLRQQVLRSPERRCPHLNVRPRPGLSRGLPWKGVWKWQHPTCMSPSVQDEATVVS